MCGIGVLNTKYIFPGSMSTSNQIYHDCDLPKNESVLFNNFETLFIAS